MHRERWYSVKERSPPTSTRMRPGGLGGTQSETLSLIGSKLFVCKIVYVHSIATLAALLGQTIPLIKNPRPLGVG